MVDEMDAFTDGMCVRCGHCPRNVYLFRLSSDKRVYDGDEKKKRDAYYTGERMKEHKCRKCGTCCKYLEFTLNKSDVNVEFYKARGVTVYEYDDHIVVIVDSVCRHLNDDNTCNIHDEKPGACKIWPQWYEGYPESCIYGIGE
jgi:Fe-S-cluster containining protein